MEGGEREILQACSYRFLQQTAKALSLPSNVKKAYLIQLIYTKKHCSQEEVDDLVKQVRLERQQCTLARKTVKIKKHTQTRCNQWHSSALSLHIVRKEKYQKINKTYVRKTNLRRGCLNIGDLVQVGVSANIIPPSAPVDHQRRLSGSVGVRQPDSLLCRINAIIQKPLTQQYYNYDGPPASRDQFLLKLAALDDQPETSAKSSQTSPNFCYRAKNVANTAHHFKYRISKSPESTITSSFEKRAPTLPDVASNFGYGVTNSPEVTSAIGYRAQDSPDVTPAFGYRVRDSPDITSVFDYRAQDVCRAQDLSDVTSTFRFRAQDLPDVTSAFGYREQDFPDVTSGFGYRAQNLPDVTPAYPYRAQIFPDLTSTFGYRIPNFPDRTNNVGYRAPNLREVTSTFAYRSSNLAEVTPNSEYRATIFPEIGLDTGFRAPNNSLVDFPQSSYNCSSSSEDMNVSNQECAVFYDKKKRAEQERSLNCGETGGCVEDECHLPRINKVFSKFNQPIYVEVASEPELAPNTLFIPEPRTRYQGSSVLEKFYNLKNVNQPLLQICTTNNTRTAYCTPVVSTVAYSLCEAYGLHVACSRLQPSCSVVHNAFNTAYSTNVDFRRSSWSVETLTSQQQERDFGANVTIPEMIEDKFGLISQEGDYRERMRLDIWMQCIRCVWAGPNMLFESHIRKEHGDDIFHSESGEWTVTYTLGSLGVQRRWVTSLLEHRASLYVLSAQFHGPDCFIATLSTISSEPESPKSASMTIYNKITGEPLTWRGDVTPFPACMPDSDPHYFCVSLSRIDLLPKPVVDSPNKVVGLPELDDIHISLMVKIFD